MILYPPLLLKIVVIMFFQHSSSLLQPINAAETKIGPHVINSGTRDKLMAYN